MPGGIGGSAFYYQWSPYVWSLRNVLTFPAEPTTPNFINGWSGSSGVIGFSESFLITAVVDEESFGRIYIFRTQGAAGAVGVDVTFENITAVNGVDYFASNTTLNWSNGESFPRVVSITTGDVDQNKQFRVRLSNPTGGATVGSDEMLVTIQHLPGAVGFVGFMNAGAFVQHDATLPVVVQRIAGSSGAISVEYNSADGTATAGVDYTAVSGTLNWADADSSSKTINVPILTSAGGGTFTVNLHTPTGGTAIFANTNPFLVTIYGTGTDGNAGELGFSVANVQTGESQNLTVSVKRVNGRSGAVSVNYQTANGTAVSGFNYTFTSGTLNWANNDDAVKTFVVPILTVGTPAFFFINLTSPGGGATVQDGLGTQTVSIMDTTATDEVVLPLYDSIEDTMLYTLGETLMDIPIAYNKGDTNVLLWTALEGGVAGWEGGTESFGSGTDLANADESLIASSPARFQMYQQLDGVLDE